MWCLLFFWMACFFIHHLLCFCHEWYSASCLCAFLLMYTSFAFFVTPILLIRYLCATRLSITFCLQHAAPPVKSARSVRGVEWLKKQNSFVKKAVVTSCIGHVRDVIKKFRCVYVRNKFRPNYSVGIYSVQHSLLSWNTNFFLVTCCVKGQRFRTLGRHHVSIWGCMFPDGSIRPSCQACIAMIWRLNGSLQK